MYAIRSYYGLGSKKRMVRDRDRRDPLQRCGLADRRAPDMRIDLHALRVRQRDNVLGGREAAAAAQVGLRDVERLLRQQRMEAEQRVLVLAAGDRNVERLAHRAVVRGTLRNNFV